MLWADYSGSPDPEEARMSELRPWRGTSGLALAIVLSLPVLASAQILDNPTWDKARIQLERQGVESERSRSEIERGRLEADRLRDQSRPIGVAPPPPPTTGEAVRRAEDAQRRGALLRESERLREQQERLQRQENKPR